MQKTKTRIFLVALVIFSLVTMSGALPVANAANMDTAKVTLGDSAPSVTSTTTVTFNLKNDAATNDKIRVNFNATGFNAATATVTCPSSGVATAAAGYVECTTFGGVLSSTTDYTIQIVGLVNPGTTGSKLINVIRNNNGDVEQENTQTMVYIIDNVSVTAHVDATLTFTVAGVNNGTSINGQTTTATTTATTTPFGTLAPNTDVIVGQRLAVSTNASNGFTVTVQQDGEMITAAGATINSFDNAPVHTGSTTPHVWANPAGTLGSENTYGHMGLTSDDAAVAGTDYTGAKFAGLNGVAALPVMSHTGPANGASTGIGTTDVAYRARISPLQEAGDYSSKLTYVCTPTY